MTVTTSEHDHPIPPMDPKDLKRPRFGSSRKWRDRRTLLLLSAPAAIWFALFMLWPLFDMFVVSFTEWNSLLDDPEPIGFANYVRLLDDPRFWTAMKNSASQIGVNMVVVVPTAFFLGFFLSREPRGHRVLAVIFFTPAITAVTAKAIMFSGLFMPDGVVNALLESVGLDSLTRFWLGDPATVLGVLIALDLWGGIGFFAVLFKAALSGISAELYEAARLEGAQPFVLMRKIAFPLARDFVGVALILHFLYVLLGSAQNVLLLTRGGPGTFSLTLPYYMYERAFVAYQIGYSQAIAAILFIVGLIGIIVIRIGFRGVET